MKSRIAAASLFLLMGVVGCDAGGSSAQSTRSAGKIAGPKPIPAKGHKALGINLGSAAYWSGERDFMNLAMGDTWRLAVNGKWIGTMDEARIDPVTGSVKSLAPGETGVLALTTPTAVPGGTVIRCTWRGTGDLGAGGNAVDLKRSAGAIEFRTNVDRAKKHTYWLILERTDPADPVRGVDCREASASPTAMYSPEFLDSLRPFGVLRFLDWQRTNENKGGSWASRTLPTSMTHSRREGVAIEQMVELANEVDADPWFHIPFNADADYITRFARLVHDTLEPDRTVYIELSNEVWNTLFPAAMQARQEGLERKLSSDPYQAQLFRYAERATAAYDIWAKVFADRPGKLVRVLGGQTANPWVAEQLLGFRDTAKHVDATATAPYFGFSRASFTKQQAQTASVDDIVKLLDHSVDTFLDKDRETRALAQKYGKRHIAYEAGQHVLMADNMDLQNKVQRSPQMEDLYRRYLAKWRSDSGDLIMLYKATGPIDQNGAWGLREYSGQPLAETPKRRAVLKFAAENR